MGQHEHTHYVEPMNRRSVRRAAATRAIIHGLVDHHTTIPFEAASTHFKTPGMIGTVAVPHELRDAADAIPVAEHGWRVSPQDMRLPHSTLGYE